MKKILSFILTFVLAFSFMSVTSFADDSKTTYSNYTASVSPANPDCIHYKDAKVIVKITKGNDVVIDAELAYDESLGYTFEGNVAGADDIIKEVGPEYDKMFDSDTYVDVLKDAGYTIEIIVEDNDPNHEFTVDEVDYYILTKATVEATTNMLANLMVVLIIEECEGDQEALEELNKMFDGTLTVKDETAYLDGVEVTFQDLLDAYKNIPESEIDKDAQAAIEEYEKMIAAMENGEYAGQLMVDASLKCSCPLIVDYTVYHEYYDVNDKYVGQIYTDGKVAEGGTVKVSDLALFTEYEGKTYKVEGYYIYDWDKDDWNYDNQIQEFQVIDEYEEILVKYVEVQSTAGGEGTASTDTVADPEKPADKATDTGDDMNILPFAVIMALAAMGMVAALRKRA